MGLASKANVGVKSQLRTRFPEAFRACGSLVEARDAASASREQTITCIDGNVAMLSVPQAVRAYDSFVGVLMNSIRQAVATSYITVVVFDEPESLTQAKVQEQLRRDYARASSDVACSRDLRVPSTDAYSRKDIESADNVQTLVRNRPTRHRFMDEVAMDVLKKVKAQIDRWSASGYVGGHLVFDGIDPRGADRPLHEARHPQIVGSSDDAVAAFERETKIGEGVRASTPSPSLGPSHPLSRVDRTSRLHGSAEARGPAHSAEACCLA